METMFSGPWPWISLIKAEPPAVSRKETCTVLLSEVFHSQFPVSDFSWSKDFCAADCASAAVAVSSNASARAMRIDFMARGLLLKILSLVFGCGAAGFLWRVRLRRIVSGWSD